LRRAVYTTNTIEGLHRQIRKAIKTRGHFPDEQAATKLIYLAIMRADAKWQRNRAWTAPPRGPEDPLRRPLPRVTFTT
jgi:putative transposase